MTFRHITTYQDGQPRKIWLVLIVTKILHFSQFIANYVIWITIALMIILGEIIQVPLMEKKDNRLSPQMLTGNGILDQLCLFNNIIIGKGQKRKSKSSNIT